MGSGPATSDQQTEVTASSSAHAVERPLLRKGDVVGRYVVLSMIGAGGMGVVYAAYDPELDRKVALKLLHHENAAPEGKRRLMREAQAMARLTHPAVITVHDVGEHDGRVFVAMEYVEGVTVREWLRGRVRSWRDVLGVYLRAGRGLVAAHELGLVHRDFKPDNVMVTSASADPDAPVQRVRVMDFGLARAFAPTSDRETFDPDRDFRPRFDALESNLTIGVAGTPAYMAPEQKADDPVDTRADQFSFCVSVWEGIYGERPFAVDSLAELAIAQLSGRIQMPRKRGVPPRIRRTLERGLAPKPGERFPSMAELLAELERDPSRRRRALAIAGGAVAVVAGAVGWIVVDRNRAQAACELTGATIADVWNDDARAAARAGLLAANPELGPGTMELVEPQIDAFADAWQSARTHACVAGTIEDSLDETLTATAIACLDEGRARFDALIGALADVSPVGVWGVSESAAQLPPPQRCVDEQWLRLRPALPEDPELRRRVGELRVELLGGPPLSTQRPTDAVERVAETVEKAEALGWEPLVAEAQLDYGIAVNGAGRHADAEKILLDAYLNALAAGDDIVAAEAAAMLTVTVGYFLGRPDEGLTWSRVGETLSKRTGEVDAHLAAQLLSVTGLVHGARGDHEAALDRHLRARALWEKAAGLEHTEVARERTNAGLALGSLGRYGEAIAELEAALTTWTAAVGPQHPEVGLILNNLGSVSLERGALDDAETFLDRALVVREATVGVQHPTYGSTLANLGNVAMGRGRYDDALDHFDRATALLTRVLGAKHSRVGILHAYVASAHLELGHLDDAQHHNDLATEIIEGSLGADHASLAAPLNNAGGLAERRSDFAAAEAAYRRSIELTERSLGPDHPELASSLTALGSLENTRARHEEAVAPLERALAIRRRAEIGGPPLAATQLELAIAYHALGRDGVRVRALAREARTHAAGGPLAQAIEAFLRDLEE